MSSPPHPSTFRRFRASRKSRKQVEAGRRAKRQASPGGPWSCLCLWSLSHGVESSRVESRQTTSEQFIRLVLRLQVCETLLAAGQAFGGGPRRSGRGERLFRLCLVHIRRMMILERLTDFPSASLQSLSSLLRTSTSTYPGQN